LQKKYLPNKKQKLNRRRKIKEGYLFSLDGIKKVKRDLGTKESFPVFFFLVPRYFLKFTVTLMMRPKTLLRKLAISER